MSDILPVQRVADFDQHYQTGRQFLFPQRFEFHEQTQEIHIDDPVWGEEVIGRDPGDEVFIGLFHNPAVKRLSAVRQLSLPEHYETIPGNADFSRWEHAWGSVVFVRKMIRDAEARGRHFDDREKVILQLRTFVSDAAHTSFSHLGDWLRQGYGGPENSHDEELMDYLELTGINDVLRRHEIEPAEVVFPDIEDWIECPSPNLCVDRVDYGCREIIRWVDPASAFEWRNAFMLDDQNRLVMRNQQLATKFALGFGFLATEHWNHPVHRLTLQLFGELIKDAVLSGPSFHTGGYMHPIDRLYTVDDDLLANTRAVGTLNNNLHAVLLDIARAQRRIFMISREKEVEHFLAAGHDSEDAHFPHPLEANSWFGEYSGVKPYNVGLEPVVGEPAEIPEQPHALRMFLPALKPRGVDPLFRAKDGQTVRLGEFDPDVANLLAECRAIQGQAYWATVYMEPSAKAQLEAGLAKVRGDWERAMERPRNGDSRESLRRAFEFMGPLAVASSRNRVSLVWE